MNKSAKLYSVFAFLLLVWGVPVTVSAHYRLHAGDLITISIFGEDELKQEVRVLPDGSISFPLAGSLHVRGKTTAQVAALIKKKMYSFIPDAEVSVVVKSPDGNRVFVLGRVNNPGEFVMLSPMTVTQVLSLAGGLSKFADEDRIKILRLTGEGQVQGYIHYEEIVSGEDLSTNHLLQAGDTIIVP